MDYKQRQQTNIFNIKDVKVVKSRFLTHHPSTIVTEHDYNDDYDDYEITSDVVQRICILVQMVDTNNAARIPCDAWRSMIHKISNGILAGRVFAACDHRSLHVRVSAFRFTGFFWIDSAAAKQSGRRGGRFPGA